MNILIQLLSILRAIHWAHWTTHWKAYRYQTHLLFQRMYEGVVEEIDGLGEKIVGEYGPEALYDSPLMEDSLRFLEAHGNPDQNMYERALEMEEHLQQAIKTAYETLKSQGDLSLGMDDFLMGLANAHETNLFLLRQALDVQRQTKTAALGDPYWVVAKFSGKDNKGRPFKKGDRVFYYPRTKTFLTGPEAEKASRDFDAAVADEGYTASVRMAAVNQPKGMEPSYEGNSMGVPLTWGTHGNMRPYEVAKAMVPLFKAARNGVAFVLDQNGVFAAAGLPAVVKELKSAIGGMYGEEYAMTSEYYEDFRPGSPEYENIVKAGNKARAVDNLRVTISPVISPTSGKSGLKVVFQPTHEQIEAM